MTIPFSNTGDAFGSKDIPQYIEIGSTNNIYIVTAEDSLGTKAKLWRAVLGFPISDCSGEAILEEVTNLPGQGLRAGVGIALGPTHATLSHTFSLLQCVDNQASHEFDFGYHRLTFKLTDCSQTFGAGGVTETEIVVEALKSTLGQVTLNPSVTNETPREGMRYSPMGGFILHTPLPIILFRRPSILYAESNHLPSLHTGVRPDPRRRTGGNPWHSCRLYRQCR